MKTTPDTRSIIKILLATAAIAGLAGCAATDDGQQQTPRPRSRNLSPSSRANHNPLLPSSDYDSNHELSS